MPITYVEGSQQITAAEHSLPFDAAFAGESDPTTCVLGIELNVSDLALGDEVLLKIYATIGAEQLPIHEVAIAGPHSTKHFALPDMMVSAGWNATLRWVSGAERTITWRLKVATGDTTAQIAAAVLAVAVETGFSLQRYLKIIGAAVAGPRDADGNFDSLAGTEDQIVGTAASGTRSGITYGA